MSHLSLLRCSWCLLPLPGARNKRCWEACGDTSSLQGAASSLQGATSSLQGDTSSLQGATSSLQGDPSSLLQGWEGLAGRATG